MDISQVVVILPASAIPPEYIVFGALWLGAFLRSIFPYLREWEADPNLIFQKKYLISFLIAGITSSFAAATSSLTYQIPNDGSIFAIALACFVAGWGLTDFLTRTMTGNGTPTYKSKKAGA